MNSVAGLIAPYAVWMVLMSVLPPAPWAYALRTAVVALMLIGFAASGRYDCSGLRSAGAGGILRRSAWGAAVGLLVLAIWILPEQFDWPWYTKWCIYSEGGTQAIAESEGWLIALRLAGSALVIPVVEELFFRRWLIGFAGFWGMVALFAVEHDRYVVGAIAGLIYGGLYLRKGLFCAITAHAVTNFALGLWVLRTGQWQFW